MKQIYLLLTALLIFLLPFSVIANSESAPSAPVLSLSINGIHVDISYTSVAGAAGYRLYYAPEDLTVIYHIDMGTNTLLSVDLWEGASFYLAVKAFNSYGESPFSNVLLLQIDNGNKPYQIGTSPEFPQGLSIESISGEASLCFDYSSIDIMAMTTMMQCISTCNDNPECLIGCYGGISLGGEGFVPLAMTIVNSTAAEIIYTIDPGTTFIPASGDTQTMMILKSKTINVPANDQLTVCLPVFCIDPALAAPGDSSVFQISGIAQKECLQKIIEKMNGKAIDLPMKIQNIIWDCVDPSTFVSQEDWDYLDSL